MNNMQSMILFVVFLALSNGKPYYPVVYNTIPTPYATPFVINPTVGQTSYPVPTVKFATVPQVNPTVGQTAFQVPTVKYATVPQVTQAVQGYGVSPVFPSLNKYHSQSVDGSYSFGYYGGPSSRAETRDRFGNVQGAFNYVDPSGKIQSQQYVADSRGFRVAGTNLPVAPVASTGYRTKRSANPEPEPAVALKTPASTSLLNNAVAPAVVPYTYSSGVPVVPTTYTSGLPVGQTTYTSGFPVVPTTYTSGLPVGQTTYTSGFPVGQTTYSSGFPVVPTTYNTGFPVFPTTYANGLPVVPTTSYSGFAQQPFNFFPTVYRSGRSLKTENAEWDHKST